MVASIAASAFLPLPPSSKGSSTLGGGGPESLDTKGLVAKPATSTAGLQVKANAQAVSKVNGTKVNLKSDTLKSKEGTPSSSSSSAPRIFYNQLPDWSVLLAAITTVFLTAEKQWTLPDWKPKRPDMLVDVFGLGKFVEGGLTFRQNFSIRSYEIGADRTASIETLMNHLQETALNHVRCAGLMGEGFGSTPEMSRRNLIWVVTKMQILIEHYPSWGDIVEVDTWVGSSGKNGMRRDWHVRDFQTGQTIMRATSVWVMMNKLTRKLSKIPEEVRAEIEPYFVERMAIVDEDIRKLPKLNDETADYVQKGLAPKWNDLDVNQHVNNVKYIGWILESAPMSLLESHELASMTLEYRRECGKDSVVHSLTAVSTDSKDSASGTGYECGHLLRLEDGPEIVRGRTEWRPKRSYNVGNMSAVPDANS